jgi:hypothetical protein
MQFAGLAVLSFCLFVFLCLDCGCVYMAIHEQWSLRMWLRLVLFLSVITWTSFESVRRRLNPTPQNTD